jgi:hypothetical protein
VLGGSTVGGNCKLTRPWVLYETNASFVPSSSLTGSLTVTQRRGVVEAAGLGAGVEVDGCGCSTVSSGGGDGEAWSASLAVAVVSQATELNRSSCRDPEPFMLPGTKARQRRTQKGFEKSDSWRHGKCCGLFRLGQCPSWHQLCLYRKIGNTHGGYGGQFPLGFSTRPSQARPSLLGSPFGAF